MVQGLEFEITVAGGISIIFSPSHVVSISTFRTPSLVNMQKKESYVS